MAEPSYATDYANGLLAHLGLPALLPARPQVHPALRWAQCGAMSLTGYPGEAAQMSPVPLASFVDGIVAALQVLCPGSRIGEIDGAALLGERAALAGHTRAGTVSPGGGCRLLPAADGWLAVNLARPDDWELLPAWLEMQIQSRWDALAAALTSRPVQALIDRGRLLGLALAALQPQTCAAPWCREAFRTPGGPRPAPAPGSAPLVVDLSALWAGPLCTHLLQRMGARVIKVESTSRPDGARGAGDGFFDLLNEGKASVALDLRAPDGRATLRRLLGCADIIVEASRPRALRQLGIHAEEVLARNPRATWVSITGHGRDEPGANWIAYGDDAGVAGGLSQVLWEASGRAMFCADAVADPLAGLHAALAAWVGFSQGGGRLYSLALTAVAAHAVRCAGLPGAQAARERAQRWHAQVRGADVSSPRARQIRGRAPILGADTARVLAEIPDLERARR
ncbi:MAG: CoA transferase [Proteobacteria bacterium]|nr:CoA transferase [Pseudomonadota bacterium]